MTRFVPLRKRQIQRHNKIRRMTSSRQLSSSCRSFINRTKILNSIATPLFLLFLESSYGSNHMAGMLSNKFFGIASIKEPPNCIVSDVVEDEEEETFDVL